jgi:hypothetical protein
MHGRTFKFTGLLSATDKIPENTSLPIYDDNLVLVGAFTKIDDRRIKGFLSGNGYPLALAISLGDSFYFTPVQDLKDYVSSAIVSDKVIAEYSVTIKTIEDT